MNVGAGQNEPEQEMIADAVRLYDQGWSIRQVAEKFDCSYGAMRRILMKHTTLRNRGGSIRPGVDDHSPHTRPPAVRRWARHRVPVRCRAFV